MKKKLWIAIGIAGLVLIMVGVSVYRTVFAKPPAVEVVDTKTEEISSLLMLPGTLELESEQAVHHSPELGELEEVLVKEGQEVKKGDILAKFKNDQLELEIEQNKISVESGYLRINQLDKQKQHLDDRKNELSKQIGKKEAEKQLAAEYDQIEMEKKLANLDLRQTLLQKEALEKRVKDKVVTSLIDGEILTINEDSQNVSDVQEPIILVANLNARIATGLLSEYDVLDVKIGQKVFLQSDAVPGKEWEGKIVKIGMLSQTNGLSNQLENQVAQYPVTVQITSAEVELKPGFQLIMEIETEKKEALVVPMEVFSYEAEKTFVYLLENGTASKREVKTGITSGERVEIIEGLHTGDKIILSPSNIVDGMEVTTK